MKNQKYEKLKIENQWEFLKYSSDSQNQIESVDEVFINIDEQMKSFKTTKKTRFREYSDHGVKYSSKSTDYIIQVMTEIGPVNLSLYDDVSVKLKKDIYLLK